MTDLLGKSEQFVHSASLVNSEATWAYLHSHKLREMNYLDQDYEELNLATPSQANQGRSAQAQSGGSTGASGASSSKATKTEPIERFSSIIDTEDPKFERQRQESLKANVQGVSATCQASIAGLNAFYQRKVESLESILASKREGRDAHIPQISLKEFDEERHLDLTLAPWVFQSLPGARSSKWPVGLADFAERLDTLKPMSLWAEPLDTLQYGIEFFDGARQFVITQAERVAEKSKTEEGAKAETSEELQSLCHDLGLGLQAIVGFAVLSANSDFLIEGLALMSQIESSCSSHSSSIFDAISGSLKKYLTMIQDQYKHRDNVRYLDTNNTSGVFSMAKYVSFAQQNEHNTSITTDGEYLYMFVAIPQKAMMYKIGTGSTESTIAGKIYIEKKADREGDVSWTYCQGKLFSRRVHEEFGLLTLYDAETLSTIGDAKLLSGDIFSSSNCQQANRCYPILTNGESIYLVTMKVVQKRRPVRAEMRQQYQQMQQDKKTTSEKATELDKSKEKTKEKEVKVAPKTSEEKQQEEKRAIERKLAEMQAREEELLRSKVAAQRGRDGRMERRGRRGGREYGRGGARVPADPRRGIPNDDPHDLKLNGGGKDSNHSDPSSYKVCQFYLHEFATTQPKQNRVTSNFGEGAGVVAELQQAFSGFFSSEECDMAYKDHNLDVCEAAYQLACDAEENRYKLTLPLSKSVLLCESLVTHETANGKKGGDGDVQVAEDSILTPTCLFSGKWVINGENVTYHQNIMQTNSLIHVFSTNDQDEKPMTQLSKSTSLPSAQLSAGNAGGGLSTAAAQLLAKDLYEQGLDGMPAGLDPSGLFDFKQPDLQRDRDFFKQMILNGEDFDEFGDAPMDFFAKEFKQLQQEKKADLEELARIEARPSGEVEEKDLFEEIKLLGTHRISLKNQEGLNPNYRGTITYDHTQRKYYVLVLANQQRYIAVVSDLHRFGENFKVPSECNQRDESDMLDIIPHQFASSQEFTAACFKMLEHVERERFNMPWRWNHWSNLFSHAISCREQLRDLALMDSPLHPLSQQLQLSKHEGKHDESSRAIPRDKSQAEKQALATDKLAKEQRHKQLQKLQTRLQKVAEAETEQLRKEYGFQYDQTQGKQLQAILERKSDELMQNSGQGKKEERTKDKEELSQHQATIHSSPMRDMAKSSLTNILERAKALTASRGLPQPILAASKAESEPAPLNPLSFASSAPASHTKSLEGERHVLPVEHILVHKEIKKIFAFCQSGSVSTLKNLFLILKHVDYELEDDIGEQSTKSDQEKQELATKKELRMMVLRQILIWATYANQLAAVKEEDRKLLNSVYKFLMDKLSAEPEKMVTKLAEEKDICWKILVVGWDFFCRSTFQQIGMLKLTLAYSRARIDQRSSEEADQALRPQVSSLQQKQKGQPGDNNDSDQEGEQRNIYQSLLGARTHPRAASAARQEHDLSPLDLVCARFFRSHDSFYELEILNKSIIKSYMVLLETEVYGKAILYLQNVSASMVEESADLPDGTPRKISSAPGIIVEEQVFEPIRRGAIDRPPRSAFDGHHTVPISLQAVPTKIKVTGQQLVASAGFASFNHAQKQGKGHKANKNAQKVQEKDQVYRRGFVLEEVAWQHLSSSRDLHPSGAKAMRVSSKLFSMSAGSAFTSDPYVVQGLSASQFAISKELQRTAPNLVHYQPRQIIRMYDDEGLPPNELGHKKEEEAALLQKVQDIHRQKATNLLDSFIDLIQHSFSDHPKNRSKSCSNHQQKRHQAECQAVLIKSFVGLSQLASAQNVCLKTISDLQLGSKVLKLIQQLLKQELTSFEQKKTDELRVSAISPLIYHLIQMISTSLLNDPSSMPLIGYKWLPGLVNMIALLKEAFKVHDSGKEQSGSTSKSSLNLLDWLQASTNEGIDFTRERIFETPHPYPQNDYSQSDTIEVPKAIGFIVELDKRCSAEQSTDQLVMYSGSDHIFQINPSFATQIKMSTKPNTRQPYLLLGSRMKIDFRSYSQRQRRGRGGAAAAYLQQAESGSRKTGQSSAQNDQRWGYRVIVRPIYSEPQNIVLAGPVGPAQRRSIYAQLGGEQRCHEVEVMLNSLVCLASQFSKEMANIESFVPLQDHAVDPAKQLTQSLTSLIPLASVKNPAIQKLAKQQLFKGGITNSQRLLPGTLGKQRDLEMVEAPRSRKNKVEPFNYHDIIQHELRSQQEFLASHFERFVSAVKSNFLSQKVTDGCGQAQDSQPSGKLNGRAEAGSDEDKLQEPFAPNPGSWTLLVRELIGVELSEDQPQISQGQADSAETTTKRANQNFKILIKPPLDKLYAKVRELVQHPFVVRQTFLRPSAKKQQAGWIDLEKLMIVSLLFHSQSLHLVTKFSEIKVPNLKSSGGVFQYGSGLKSSLYSEENYFVIDQLKLIGNQLNDMLMWLILRVQGEMDAQEIIHATFEATQRMIDERMEKKKVDDEQQKREQEEKQKQIEEERKQIEEAEAKVREEIKKKMLVEEEQKLKEEQEQHDAARTGEAQNKGGRKLKAPAVAVLVTGNKNRKMKRGKIVRSAIDTSKAKQIAKKDQQKKQNKTELDRLDDSKKEDAKDDLISSNEIIKTAEQKKLEQQEGKKMKDSAAGDGAVDEPKYADLTLSQINELKNRIEQQVYADFSGKYLGAGADPHTLKPLCLLFKLKYNAEDPTETVRQLFKKIKGRINKVINLDDNEDIKLPLQIDGVRANMEHFMQSPYVEVCKDVKRRLLILLEVKPSIEYLNNVTKIGTGKCFSRYGSIKFSQKGGLTRGLHPAGGNEASESEKDSRQDQPSFKELDPWEQENNHHQDFNEDEKEDAQHSQHDDEDDDELADKTSELQRKINVDDEDGDELVPLGLERSKSQQIGLRPTFKIKHKLPMQKVESSNVSGHHKLGKQAQPTADQQSQGDWLEIHRKWKQWNRFHKQAGGSTEDRDLTSPFCSPLHSVLQFAKNSEIVDPSPVRDLLCEQEKRAAFRLFALKYQGKLYDVVQGTPYQRFIWGNQSHSLVNSSLDRIEACGETLVNKINERSKKLVQQLMNYTVIQADNMKHYQDILEKYLKQQDAKSSSSSQTTKATKQAEQLAAKKSATSAGQSKDHKTQHKGSSASGSTAESSSSYGSQPVNSEQQDRRIQRMTFDDFIPWQMKTVMHSLNDLRVLLSDPFTQAHILEALKEDQFKFSDQNLEKRMKLTARDKHLGADRDAGDADGENNGPSNLNISRTRQQESELGFQNIKQFLKALIQIMVQSNSSSPLAAQFPNSARLCQSAFKVAKIVLSQFVSDKQQIREAETSKTLQEMMLEILVSHLEKVCGLDQPQTKAKDLDAQATEKLNIPSNDESRSKLSSSLARPIEDTNLDEIVQLLKLLQEVMRLSSDSQRAFAQHQMVAQQIVETQSNNAGQQQTSNQIQQHSQFLSPGSVQAMRCAKLLAYLMIEFEVPVVVRHAIRCARIFFFGLVDFEKLELYQTGEWEQMLSKIAAPDEQDKQADAKSSSIKENQDEFEGELSSCCQNKFILATLKKIGERISNSQQVLDKGADSMPQESQSVPSFGGAEAMPKPEGSSLVEDEQIVSAVREQLAESPEDSKVNSIQREKEHAADDETKGKKYVVYANINSQSEDFTFLVTALYHWETLRPAIHPTQPNDPKQFVQKSSHPQKREKAAQKEKVEKPGDEAAAGAKAVKEELIIEPKKDAEKKDDEKEEKKEVPVDKAGAEVDKNEESSAAGALEAVAGLFAKPEGAAEEVAELKVAELPEEVKQEAAESLPPAAEKKNEEGEADVNAVVEEEKEKQLEVKDEPKQEAGEDGAKQDQPEVDQNEQAKKDEEESKIKKEEGKAEKPEGEQAEVVAEEPKVEQLPDQQEESKQDKQEQHDTGPDLREHFELFRLKKEAQQKCDTLLEDIAYIEANEDLLALLEQQQKQSYQIIIGDLVKKDSHFLQASASLNSQALAQAMATKSSKGVSGFGASLFGSSEAMKLLRDSQLGEAKVSLEKRLMLHKELSKMSSQASISAGLASVLGQPRHAGTTVIKGAIVGSGNQMSEVNLVPNKILMLGSQAQQAASHSINQKLSINTLQTAFVDIAKHSSEVIYDDDSAEEQMRKLNSKNHNDRIMHHLFQAMCIASQLQARYSVPITEPLEHSEAVEFAKLLQQAYTGQIEAVPINPYLKEEFHHKKVTEGKKLSQYFPLTLTNVMAGMKQPELQPGHAPPVVICQKTLVVSLLTDKFSKDIEKIIESRSTNLKALEKSPSDGFRWTVCKNNTKRQGSSVSNCILTLIQFSREILVGQVGAEDKKAQGSMARKKVSQFSGTDQAVAAQAFNDSASQKSSVAAFSESNHNFNQSERHDSKQANRVQRQQEMRQSEIMKIINHSLRILKTTRWKDAKKEDKQILLGLFAVIGGWYGFTRVDAGSQVRVQINGCWHEATVIDEGVGKRRISVILNEDASLALVKVPHSKVKPHQTSIDKGINDKLNFDDLCEAITFLHNQQQDRLALANEGAKEAGDPGAKVDQVSIADAMISEQVLFQMLLKVCSKLNWDKIDQKSNSFKQFRQILIQVTSQPSQTDGQSHEDKNKDYLEKQLMESWERIIDRDEAKNLDFYSPKEFAVAVDDKISLSLKRETTPESSSTKNAGEEQALSEVVSNGINPYIDTDYVQPMSSYLHGLPEPTIEKNQKEAALKLLFYWEKNVLPTTREFVRSTFQKWEMNYYFEQIRHHLRRGDQRAAFADALVLWENKVPNGVTLPSENTDWTAKVADECIVDSWALAKLTFSKSTAQPQPGSQHAGKQAHSQQEASLPLLIRLQNLGVQAIVIQIKLVDSRYNVVLGEFYDVENFCSHFIWLPISHLYELDYPLPPRAVGYSRKNLTLNYLQSISNINSLYARQTLIKFFSSCHQTISTPLDRQASGSEQIKEAELMAFKQDQFGELKLHELISWSVQEEFSNNPFNGWIQALDCAIPIKTRSAGGRQAASVTQEQLNWSTSTKTTAANTLQQQYSIQQLIEETSDEIIIEKLLRKERQTQNDHQAQDSTKPNHVPPAIDLGSTSSNPLGLIRDLCKNAVLILNRYKGQGQEQVMKECDAYKTLSELADWIFVNWIQMSEQVSSSSAVFDLCKQDQLKQEGDGEQSSDSQLIALHSVIQQSNKSVASQERARQQSIATLLMFHKVGCYLTPCSKIQFYSDPTQVNLVSEITAGAEGKTTLPPLLLNHGQIWAKVQPGSLALLRREQQLDAQSSLPCAVFQIPKQWSVVCWLTDVLSTSFLEHCENSIDLAKEIYHKLIKAIAQFYQDSQSPQMIKGQVLKLLTRLIRKLRFILKQDIQRSEGTPAAPPSLTQAAHLEQLSLNPGFIKHILDDIDTFRREEEKAQNATEATQKQLLYSSFIQDSVEFLMTIVIPINKHAELKSYKDLLQINQDYLSELQEWLDPLMKTSLFMHFFNNELKCLPHDLMREIHNQTKLQSHQGLDHVLLIKNVPRDEQLYPRAWLTSQIVGLCKKHHARILNPLKDIYFEDNEYTQSSKEGESAGQVQKSYTIALLLDGWDHMHPLPDMEEHAKQQGKVFGGFDSIGSTEYREFVDLLESDTEDEGEAVEDVQVVKAAKQEPEKPAEEEIKPTEWTCEICTFINPMTDAACGICGQGRRPAMEALIAAIRAARLEALEASAPEKDGAESGVVEEDDGIETIPNENMLRLKFLAEDLTKVVKVEQKRRFKEQQAANLERLRLQKAKEKEEKAAAEAAKLQSAEVAADSKEDAKEAGPAEVIVKSKSEAKKEEEKKHGASDAEKSDEEEDQWQDEDSGGSGSSSAIDKKSLMAMTGEDILEPGEAKKPEPEGAESQDPRLKKLADLGYDLSILDADPALAEALLASANLQEEKEQEEQREQKEAAEAEKARKEEEKRRLQKEKELEQLKKQGLTQEKVEYNCLAVHRGIQAIQADPGATRTLFKFMSARLLDPASGELTESCKQALREIHATLQEQQADMIVWLNQPFEDQLAEDYGLTKESIKAMEFEEFEQTCSLLVAADVILLFRFLECQGYDYWLHKQAYSSFKPAQQAKKFDTNLIEKLKEFVEISFCEEKKVIQQLSPYQLRLLSKSQDKKPAPPIAEANQAELQPKEGNQTVNESQITSSSSLSQPKTSLMEEQIEEQKRSEQHANVSEMKPDVLELDAKGKQVSALNDEPIGYYDDAMLEVNASQQGDQHWFNQVSQPDVSYNWALIKTFSKYFAIAVPFINCSTSIADNPDEGAIPITLSAYMSSLRNLCLSNTKYELKHLILKKTSVEQDKPPVLHFERLKLHSDNDQGEAVSKEAPNHRDDQAELGQTMVGNQSSGQTASAQAQNMLSSEKSQAKNFMFTQAYEQMKDIDCAVLRPSQPKGTDPHLSFEIYFKGEDVVGMGGPYRQFFSDVSQELQMVAERSSHEDDEDREDADNENADGGQGTDGNSPQSTKQYLGLLYPSRNMQRNSEIGKDNFVLNPQKVSSHDLSLYNFLGLLMGVCIRTNTNLSINLPSLVWKQLVGQRLTIDDIQEFDDGIVAELKQMLTSPNQDDFENRFGDRSFITNLSDGSSIALEEGGAQRVLTFTNRTEYVRKTLYARMKECELQCDAIKRGICQIIPEALLNMVSYQELEEWIYGKKTIDVELLKRHAEYAQGTGGSESTEIVWFWEILREMNQEDRRKFIRFCFAQSTIPPNDEEFERRQLRFLIKPVLGADKKKKDAKSGSQDQRLPKADTCFFNFELPSYSTKEVMRRQILFAISFDNVSLNAEQEDMQMNDHLAQRSHDSRDSNDY